MALGTCLNCGQKLSDKAVKCPHCGSINKNYINYVKPKKCKECGAQIPDGASICFDCGCPVNGVVQYSTKEHLSTGAVIGMLSLVVVVFAVILFVIVNY